MYEIDVADYVKFADRPWPLKDDMFFRPVDYELTPELFEVARVAEELLVGEGFNPADTEQRVGIHIQAAASLASRFEDYNQLAEGMSVVFGDEWYSRAAAFAVVPFISHVAPFNIDVGTYVNDIANEERNYDYDRVQAAMRWLELWAPEVCSEGMSDLFSSLVRSDPHSAYDEFARYGRKMVRLFEDEPERASSFLGSIPDRLMLPLAGELGLEHELLGRMRVGLGVRHDVFTGDAVRSARRVDHYTGECGILDYWHLSAMGYDPITGFQADSGEGGITLVEVRGELIGGIKMWGDKSFMSYVTAEGADASTPLVKGGAYGLNKPVVDAAEAAFVDQGGIARISLDELVVRPLRFVVDDTVDSDHFAKVRALQPFIDSFRQKHSQ